MRETLGQPSALEALTAAVAEQWPEAEVLDRDWLNKRLPLRGPLVAGWRLKDVLSAEPNDLILAVNQDFPWSLPVFALPEATNAIGYPHIERDGYLCLTPASSAFELPVGVRHCQQLLEEARTVLRDGQSGANERDFYDEAQSYWSLINRARGEIWLTEATPTAQSLWVSGCVEEHLVVAPDKQALLGWAKSSGRRLTGTVEPCVMVKLDKPLHPRDYPLTMKDLGEFLVAAGAGEQLNLALARWHARRELPVVITFEHGGKTVSLGAVFMAPRQVKLPGARHAGVPGFRHGHKGRGSGRLRALSLVPTRFPHLRVTTVFRSFLHSRTAGESASPLADKHVVIAGCGALGGQLAVQLAQAGVGTLTLLDNDVLTWQNVGRHVLDASYVGQSKALALADAIRKRFPDARVESIGKTWQAYAAERGAAIDSADLMIAATGDPAGNLQLDTYVAAGEAPATVFGWIEPFGVAAHAVFSHAESKALQQLSDAFGRLIHPVADLESAPPLPREPACGAFFQPYSSLSALPSVFLIGEMALEALQGRLSAPVHRVWVGNADEFSKNGLSFTPDWGSRLSSLGFNRRYDFVV